VHAVPGGGDLSFDRTGARAVPTRQLLRGGEPGVRALPCGIQLRRPVPAARSLRRGQLRVGRVELLPRLPRRPLLSCERSARAGEVPDGFYFRCGRRVVLCVSRGEDVRSRGGGALHRGQLRAGGRVVLHTLPRGLRVRHDRRGPRRVHPGIMGPGEPDQLLPVSGGTSLPLPRPSRGVPLCSRHVHFGIGRGLRLHAVSERLGLPFSRQ